LFTLKKAEKGMNGSFPVYGNTKAADAYVMKGV